MKFTKLTMLALMAAASAGAVAQQAPATPDPTKGQAMATTVCVACHAADGNAIAPTFPKLAGQHYDYIVKQLTNFKVQPGAQAPERDNAQMLGFASMLTEDQVRDVAAYFSSQKLQPASAANKDSAELGQKIFRAGIASKGVAACAGCHGPNGGGIPGQYPRIGGQWSEYAEAQLTAFRQGVRKNNPTMADIAGRLSDVEIKAVADYVAGLR